MQTLHTVLAAIHPWQTLIGGCIAIVAAVIAFWNTTRTLNSTKALERARRSKKQHALRAALPLVLSELSEYAEELTDQLAALEANCVEGALHHNTVSSTDFPATPAGVVTALTAFLEHTDDLDTSILVVTLRRIQIYQARVRNLANAIRTKPDDVTTQYYIEELMINSATVYACASVCFDYGRGKAEVLPSKIGWDDVRSALNLMEYRDFDKPELHAHLDAWAEGDADPE